MAEHPPIELSRHALEQCALRGETAAEIRLAIEYGVREPARLGRWMYRYNPAYDDHWQGTKYAIKQVAPIVAEEPDRLVVIAVYPFFF